MKGDSSELHNTGQAGAEQALGLLPYKARHQEYKHADCMCVVSAVVFNPLWFDHRYADCMCVTSSWCSAPSFDHTGVGYQYAGLTAEERQTIEAGFKPSTCLVLPAAPRTGSYELLRLVCVSMQV